MRVVQVMGSSAGGVVRHVGEIAGLLADGGHRVVVAAPAAAQSSLPGLETGRYRVMDCEIADRPRPGDFAVIRQLGAVAAGADIVHAHGLRAGALAVLAMIGRRHRPGVIVTLHNLPVGSRAIRFVSRVLETIVARGADTVLGVSGDLVELARRRGAGRAERALVPAPPRRHPERDGVDVRRELSVGDAALVLTVARLAPQKGLDLLCDTAGLLASADVPILWAVAGDGPLETELRARIAAERLPVALLGRRTDIADLMAAADIAVNTSVWEGQPLVVQEALAAGIPVVATDVGGTREVMGDAGILVPWSPQDPSTAATAMAAAIDTLVGDVGARDRQRAASLAAAAELPDAAATAAQLTRVYREARSDR